MMAETILPPVIQEMVNTLQSAFPDGLSKPDYMALLAALYMDVAEENLGLAVGYFTKQDPSRVVNDAAEAVSTLRPSQADVLRIRRTLEAVGWRFDE
jgi:hypothetical protein